ncbi:MAG: lysostaphin resistance A-like protein [Candidatus Nanopelagicales bacterium]
MTARAVDPRRVEPQRDMRRLAIYFGVLAVVYAIGLAVLGGAGFNAAVPILMVAPTVGALAARFLGPGIIWWGRPSWWILAGLLPVAVVVAGLLLGSAAGWIVFAGGLGGAALYGLSNTAVACITAAGEEIGWRGFLWPLLRSRMTFLVASGVIGLIWLAFHLPIVLLGEYGSLAGLPAFTVAIIGFVLFVGVLTDRSRSVWPSVLAHGAWNGVIALNYPTSVGEAAFTGDTALLGEFGWIPAVSMLLLGVAAAFWHVRSGHGGKIAPGPAWARPAPGATILNPASS